MIEISTVIKPIVSSISKSIYNSVVSKLTNKESSDTKSESIEKSIEKHICKSLNWASQFQHFNMAAPVDIEDVKIELKYVIPRKLQKDTRTIINEDELLDYGNHLLIVGSPGSGKTTTLKGLVRKIILTESKTQNDQHSFPLVIRFRDCSNVAPIETYIAEILGIKYEIDHTKVLLENNYYVSVDGTDIALVYVIADLLDKFNSLVLLDGLDEIADSNNRVLTSSIIRLAELLFQSRIILTCRSGGYQETLNGFSVIETAPLSEQDINDLCRAWIPDNTKFIKELKNLPYFDVSTRPLLLTNLIVVYKNYGYLPNQPTDVYQLLLRLQLQEWDEQRGLSRNSKYAKFGADKKLEFLSALSFHLLYKRKQTTFSRKDLLEVYDNIHFSFELPKESALDVASEIETHNGIIAEISEQNFEFSHLSTQEYLCAYYMVRDSLSYEFNRYMLEYPAPVAVALSMSSRPSNMLCVIASNDHIINSQHAKSWSIFITRLLIEKPIFEPGTMLGLSALKLMFMFERSGNIQEEREAFLSINGMEESLNKIISLCEVTEESNNGVFLHIKFKGIVDIPYFVRLPIHGWVTKEFYYKYLNI